MFSLLKKHGELPRSGPIFLILAALAVVLLVSDLSKGAQYVDYYLLCVSVLLTITGIGMAFSKKEREGTRAKVTSEVPERVALINAPDAEKITQRRGYYSLALGFVLFLIWCWYFGFSSLAIGV